MTAYSSWPRDYWSWLREEVKLTFGGRCAFTLLALIGLIAAVAGTGLAFYNVESGQDPDQVLLPQMMFSWFVVGLFEGVTLGLVIAVDAAFRFIASRFVKPAS